MTRARARWIGALVLALLCACASDKQTDAPNTATRGSRHSAEEEQAAAIAPAQQAPTEAPIPAEQIAKPAEEAKAAEKEKRDFSAELLAAVGSPVQCLKPRTAGPDVPSQISIAIDATVVETGLVTRAYASSSQLDAEELKCVEQRLSTLRMRAPIEDAPRSIRATIELALQPPAPAPQPEGAEQRAPYGGGNAPAAPDPNAAQPEAPQP
jgi:hypothetical protein